MDHAGLHRCHEFAAELVAGQAGNSPRGQKRKRREHWWPTRLPLPLRAATMAAVTAPGWTA